MGSEMAQTLQRHAVSIYSAWSPVEDQAKNFAEQYAIETPFSDYDQLLADPNLEAVYVATPNSTHYEFIRKALTAKKHVLSEKPVVASNESYQKLLKIAKTNHVVLMQGMTIFHMPLFKTLKKLIENNKIGDLKMISVNFGSIREANIHSRYWDRSLGGGALMDIGIYAIALAQYFMQLPINEILSTVRNYVTEVDEQSVTILKNSAGQMAGLTVSMDAKQPKRAVLAGNKGYFEINEFPRADAAKHFDTATGTFDEITAGTADDALYYEYSDFLREIDEGTSPQEIELTEKLLTTMDDLRKQWDLDYPYE